MRRAGHMGMVSACYERTLQRSAVGTLASRVLYSFASLSHFCPCPLPPPTIPPPSASSTRKTCLSDPTKWSKSGATRAAYIPSTSQVTTTLLQGVAIPLPSCNNSTTQILLRTPAMPAIKSFRPPRLLPLPLSSNPERYRAFPPFRDPKII
jgi:hypothetical protein